MLQIKTKLNQPESLKILNQGTEGIWKSCLGKGIIGNVPEDLEVDWSGRQKQSRTLITARTGLMKERAGFFSFLDLIKSYNFFFLARLHVVNSGPTLTM